MDLRQAVEMINANNGNFTVFYPSDPLPNLLQLDRIRLYREGGIALYSQLNDATRERLRPALQEVTQLQLGSSEKSVFQMSKYVGAEMERIVFVPGNAEENNDEDDEDDV